VILLRAAVPYFTLMSLGEFLPLVLPAYLLYINVLLCVSMFSVFIVHYVHHIVINVLIIIIIILIVAVISEESTGNCHMPLLHISVFCEACHFFTVTIDKILLEVSTGDFLVYNVYFVYKCAFSTFRPAAICESRRQF